ncbi:MAG TPA: c-type cytochrome [Candidatus Methylomirabilis sp.]|nr:c-type cytochrome [Candidatus Methylomirabilis sp.]
MMKREVTGLVLLAGAGLFSLAVATSAAADVNKMVETCAACHGKEGDSHESDVPTIGGMSAPYIKDNLTAYKNKERPCPETKFHEGPKKGQKTDMCQVAKELSDGDMKELADYYAGKKFFRANQKFDAALAQKGKEIHDDHCEKCHSNGGSLASDDAGILAGQWMPYLEATFKEYKSGKRPMEKKMKPKIDKLTPGDIQALLNYYGSFK